MKNFASIALFVFSLLAMGVALDVRDSMTPSTRVAGGVVKVQGGRAPVRAPLLPQGHAAAPGQAGALTVLGR
jgi:hypothetical protein